MTLSKEYLEYPRRRAGMDHDRYDYSRVSSRKPVEWPDGARIALWIVPALEFFPLNMGEKPFRPPGAMERPYPDYWNYTLRDYGNRVGVFRVFSALDARGLKASVAVNARVAERMPFLIDEINRRGWEIIAHGVDMAHLHHAGLSEAEERALIDRAVTTLHAASGQKVTGWLSPAMAESFRTLDLLAEAGIEYLCDWVNDDLPYPMRTQGEKVFAMPHAYEIDDLHLFWQYKHRPSEFVDQVLDHFELLHKEAGRHGGRIMALSLHPWIIGVPHRIKALEEALDRIVARRDVWSATGAEILAAFRAQQ
jgi:allantoinase